jgi:hypothetical protein
MVGDQCMGAQRVLSLLVDFEDGVLGGTMDCLSGEVWFCSFFTGGEREASSCCDLSNCMRLMLGDSISTKAFRFRGLMSMGLLPVLDVKCNGSGLSVGKGLE